MSQFFAKLYLAITLLSLFGNLSSAQNNIEASIVEEGKLLYRLEMASWNGTDLFVKKHDGSQNIGGYFSYLKGDLTVCLFFSTENEPKVIGTLTFDKTLKPKKAKLNLETRVFSDEERSIYEIRKIAMKEIETDTLFKRYKNTGLNVIPIITLNSRKVYVLTAPKHNGVVIFGNDYLLTFDKANKLESKKCLHANIISIEYGEHVKLNEGKPVVGSIHSHSPETGSYITATDICTLMLYAKFAKWKSHQVISEDYLNIWNCETESLLVINRNQLFKK